MKKQYITPELEIEEIAPEYPISLSSSEDPATDDDGLAKQRTIVDFSQNWISDEEE